MPRGSAHRGIKIAPKVQMPRWNDTAILSQTQLSTIPQTQQLQMHVYRISAQQSQCSALVMQSEANQSIMHC